MGRTNPVDSSKELLSDVELTVTDYLIPSNRGYYDYQQQDACKSGAHDAKLLSKSGASRILTGGVQEDSNQSAYASTPARKSVSEIKTGAVYNMVQPTSIENAGHGQGPYMKADSRHQPVRSHAEGANMNIPLRRPVELRKNFLPLPPWFKDLVKTSNVTPDMDGWEHYEIIRNDYSAADKYFTHKHYRHTFRSEPEVARFLATGEVKRNRIWQKISADCCGQDPGASRPTKRKAVPHTTPTNNPQGSGWPRGGNSLTFISRELREQGWL